MRTIFAVNELKFCIPHTKLYILHLNKKFRCFLTSFHLNSNSNISVLKFNLFYKVWKIYCSKRICDLLERLLTTSLSPITEYRCSKTPSALNHSTADHHNQSFVVVK